jgi:hypothetical protein
MCRTKRSILGFVKRTLDTYQIIEVPWRCNESMTSAFIYIFAVDLGVRYPLQTDILYHAVDLSKIC